MTTDLNVLALAEKAHWDKLKIIHGLKPDDKKAFDLSAEEARAEVEKRTKR